MQDLQKQLRDEIEEAITTAFDESIEAVRSSEICDAFVAEHEGLIRQIAYPLGVRMVRRLIQDKMKKCGDSPNEPEQVQLFKDLKGLPQAITYEENKDDVVYIARRNALRVHYRSGLDYLDKLMVADANKRNAMETADLRLEPLREKFGDLPESELLARASQEVA